MVRLPRKQHDYSWRTCFFRTHPPVPSRNVEATLDVEWSGAMAPGADLVVYAGPDARNTSMVYTFNEAIARGEVDMISDSFAHREDSEPFLVEEATTFRQKWRRPWGSAFLPPAETRRRRTHPV